MTSARSVLRARGCASFTSRALACALSISGCCAPFVAAPLLSGCAPNAAAPSSQSAEIPVHRVVLYQNGVGYFERVGKVDGNVLTLQIRPSQINDILKSLTVIDRAKGRAVSVSLPLEENADRLLNELPEQVRNAGGLLEVLRVFRGAHVSVQGGKGSVAGRVIGVENLQTDAGDEVAADWRLSLKTAEGGVVVYPVADIRRVDLHDRTLSVGLERSLDVSLGEGGWKPIALSIRLAGEGPHDLLASYIVEMPRWKPAYRLVLDEGKAPLLQAWAAVDNVSGEGWSDVRLSLVSGSPISFKYNLHAPQYADRVDLTPVGLPRAEAPPPPEAPGMVRAEMLEKKAASRRKAASGAMDAKEEEASEYSYGDDEDAAGGFAPKPAPAPAAAEAVGISSEALLQQQGEEAEATRVGALFRYDVSDPVTIPDRSSTLVSIVNQRVKGQEVVYFRPELTTFAVQSHPYRAVKFTNGTGFTLEKGPITVYSSGTFVGEGFVERMESGVTSFLTFAIDGSVLLDTHGGSREEGLHLLRIQDGRIVSEVQEIQTTTYEVTNRHDEAVTAYIRSAKRSGWKLKNEIAGTVDTPEAMIVPLVVAGGKSAKVDVEWWRRAERTVAVDSRQVEDLFRVYLRGGKAPPKLAAALEEILKLKSEVNEATKEEQRLREQHDTLSRDQDRVRANLNTLRKTQGNHQLKADLARKLGTLEEELGKLSGQLVQLSEKRAELEAKMRALIGTISLESR